MCYLVLPLFVSALTLTFSVAHFSAACPQLEFLQQMYAINTDLPVIYLCLITTNPTPAANVN